MFRRIRDFYDAWSLWRDGALVMAFLSSAATTIWLIVKEAEPWAVIIAVAVVFAAVLIAINQLAALIERRRNRAVAPIAITSPVPAASAPNRTSARDWTLSRAYQYWGNEAGRTGEFPREFEQAALEEKITVWGRNTFANNPLDEEIPGSDWREIEIDMHPVIYSATDGVDEDYILENSTTRPRDIHAPTRVQYSHLRASGAQIKALWAPTPAGPLSIVFKGVEAASSGSRSEIYGVFVLRNTSPDKTARGVQVVVQLSNTEGIPYTPDPLPINLGDDMDRRIDLDPGESVRVIPMKWRTVNNDTPDLQINNNAKDNGGLNLSAVTKSDRFVTLTATAQDVAQSTVRYEVEATHDGGLKWRAVNT